MKHLREDCTVHHINFGGGCLNCGAMPEPKEAKTMFTRQDYLDKKCNHRQYYAQFVDARLIAVVSNRIGKELRLVKDENLNYIPLARWDEMAKSIRPGAGLKKAGDYQTLAGQVCILKEAARQAMELSN